jgi:phage repressor protein C with HTH and peptisase S24 domain
MSIDYQKRLETEIERVGGVTVVAKKLGIVRNTVYNWIQKANVPLNMLIELQQIGVDLSYILSDSSRPTAQINERNRPYQPNENYIQIPHYNVHVAAGTGAYNGHEEEVKNLAFRRDWLASRNLSPANLAIVEVVGDSMQPYLADGDLVLVDRSQTEITSGRTYVLRMDSHLLVKNLQMLPHGLVQVASFNSGYQPYQIDLADEGLDMAVIGRVVASMHEW